VKLQQAKQQQEAAAEIVKLGGEIQYDWQRDPEGHNLPDAKMPTPKWLRSLLGNDLFQSVSFVRFEGTKVTDSELEHLKGLRHLQQLLLENTQVTDAGLEQLQGLSQLKWLNLEGTQVTESGLEHLKGLSNLQELQLDKKVTDAGMENLKGLSQLKKLCLVGTKLTEGDVKKLHQALPNCKIYQLRALER
jgi:hypothetical protein